MEHTIDPRNVPAARVASKTMCLAHHDDDNAPLVRDETLWIKF